MLYNALLHIHANNLSDLTIFYESKQCLFKTSSLQIISGKNKNKKKYDITKNKQEEKNLKCKVIAKSESGEILELNKNLVESILSGNIEFVENKEEIDNKSSYVYEFNDEYDLSLINSIKIQGNEQFWYPFLNDPNEIFLFETEFQNILNKRKKFKLNCLSAIQIAEEESHKKKSKKHKKHDSDEENEGGEEENEDSKENENHNEEEVKQSRGENQNEKSILKKKIKRFLGTDKKIPGELIESIEEKLNKTKERQFEYKTTLLGMKTTRECVFTKENINNVLLLPDDQLEGKIVLGHTQPKGREAKRRIFRRLSHYNLTNYREDPIAGKRIKVTISKEEKKTEIDDDNKKKNKDKLDKNSIFTMGCGVTFDPKKYFTREISYSFKLSDEQKIEEIKEDILNIAHCEIESNPDITDILREAKCKKGLEKLFDFKVEENIAKISNSNPWIQQVLGVLILTKDFINSEESFDLSLTSKKNSNITFIFDKYWNFGEKEITFEVNQKQSEFSEILFERKGESEVQRIQNFCMNLCFRGLAYFYKKNGVEFTFEKIMIRFKRKKGEKYAKKIALIEDMSYLMATISQYNIEKYDKKALKELKDEVILICERICFEEPTSSKIPALLPMYIITINESNSDESESDDEKKPKKSIKKSKAKRKDDSD